MNERNNDLFMVLPSKEISNHYPGQRDSSLRISYLELPSKLSEKSKWEE